jgi:hypothetical protein
MQNRGVDLSWVLDGGLGGAGGAAVGMYARYLDLVRRLTPEERARWDALSPGQKHTMRKTVRRGDAVGDLELAPVAVKLAAAERPTRLGVGFALFLGLLFVYAAAWSLTTQVYGMTVLGVLLASVFLGVLWKGQRIRRRLDRAAVLNAGIPAP